jgi:hypothetical protein
LNARRYTDFITHGLLPSFRKYSTKRQTPVATPYSGPDFILFYNLLSSHPASNELTISF